MKKNSRLVLVGVLVFVFPLLFVAITQSFFATAYSNIDTAEKRRVSLLHESIANVLLYADNYEVVTKQLIASYTNENTDITKIRIVALEQDEVRVLFAQDESLVGTLESSEELFRTLPALGAGDTIIYPTNINNVRTWQTFRSVQKDDQQLVIFSEHSFAVIDAVMSARQQQSYFGLLAIFMFLIGLAYWINKQTSWENKHHVLQEQLKERDLFSNMIAHEFRAPLTAIKGYASFLEESETISVDERHYANNIRLSAQRLVILVNDFLEVARLQSGKMSVNKVSIDIRDVLQQVTEDLGPMAREKKLRLVYDAPVQPILLTTDRARLLQVLTNIVSNSLKYTPEGVVELVANKEGKLVQIIVKDTGTGISAADQKKLFSPFTRVGGVDATTTTGSGLGMWITQQLVVLLGGTIGVESIKGTGTNIVMEFKE